MKRAIVVFAILSLVSIAAMAQDFSKAEVFGGYSYVRLNDIGQGFNFNGGAGSISINPNSTLGLVADFGGYHTSSFGSDANLTTYLFGPKLAMRSEGQFTPFVHALFGGAHISGGGASDNAFAMALGGGIDAKMSEHVALRVVQLDYLLTKFSNGANDRQNSLRASTGIVFRF